jgi:hypothetical protein
MHAHEGVAARLLAAKLSDELNRMLVVLTRAKDEENLPFLARRQRETHLQCRRQWVDGYGRHLLIMLPNNQTRELLLRADTLTWEMRPLNRTQAV